MFNFLNYFLAVLFVVFFAIVAWFILNIIALKKTLTEERRRFAAELNAKTEEIKELYEKKLRLIKDVD